MLHFLPYVLYVILLSACSTPRTLAYKKMYAHLDQCNFQESNICDSPYFLLILVDACHLDYTENYSFISTMVKHPNGCKDGDIGHAWIYLQGLMDEKPVSIEGGHTGEFGIVQARYFDGIMNYLDFGYANPTAEQLQHPRLEPNPAKYLWETQQDGIFQWGSNHQPTFAAKVELTPAKFYQILSFIENYPYEEYAITGNQCSSFVAQVASLVGLDLECEVTMLLEPYLHVRGRKVQLWIDPSYSLLTFASPDILEKSLMQAVKEGKAEYALDWYKNLKKCQR